MPTELKTSINTGQLIPNFHLAAANRSGQVGPSDYKQHRNLVLIFFRTLECLKCKDLLREIAEYYGEYQQMEAEVIAISSDEIDRLREMAQDLALPFPVLSDNVGRVGPLPEAYGTAWGQAILRGSNLSCRPVRRHRRWLHRRLNRYRTLGDATPKSRASHFVE